MNNYDSQFTVEFYAYNISSKGIFKKIYLLPKYLRDTKAISLSPEEISFLSEVLNNENLISFLPDSYTLCDFSFRGIKHVENVGFSFKIIDDSNYRDSFDIFKSFKSFDAHDFCNTINILQESLFAGKAKFNPLSMIGLLFDQKSIQAIKAYVRFDYNRIKSFSEREKLLEGVINTFNPESLRKNIFLNTGNVIEKLGFKFAFIGIDCDASGKKRYKIYYCTSGKYELLRTYKDTKVLLSNLGLYNNISDIFNENYSGMWGFAVSTTDFNDINGLQLYFIP